MAATQGLDLQKVQLIRKAVLLVGIIALLALAAVTGTIGGETRLHEGLETFGLVLIAVCIVGRAWCSLYIGGRKKAEIVDRGPYSISRNPLYVFSFIGAFGMGAQSGSFSIAALFLLVTFVVFYSTVKREEAWLAGEFGEPYLAYMKRTPRFGPNFSRWQDKATLEIRPTFFLTTLRDGAVMLLAVPLFELIERSQTSGWLATLIHLP
ncbi:isoprenylcysteine carboxylmethyltransferase family protein [uncultured Brevundimonas sp.]|uniref:methyltransferase family protein n=1 Tax=uncultured Brevundimonas sp. TaxID=213418 RepID=UPI0030EBA344|tara:strand:+ start:739 stop:1362 length:624 start_codon:yes stop_codon:yes gene_type:complete